MGAQGGGGAGQSRRSVELSDVHRHKGKAEQQSLYGPEVQI